MKKILGLDLGTASIGWAVVNEAENENERSSITKLGVRTIHFDNFVSTESGKESKEPEKDFISGKGISPNAGRTKKRAARKNLQRYKLRKENLIEVLKENGFISDETIFSENGNKTTFETYRLRAKAVTEEITKEQLVRILLMINKKRGYKSSRKAKSQDEGQLIDGMEIAKKLYQNDITPGQYVNQILNEGKNYIPDFYRSDLQYEFDKIWEFQKQFHQDILTDDFKRQIVGKGKTNTTKIFLARFGIYTADNKGGDRRMQAYQWRVDGLFKKLTKEELAFVISDVNGIISNSSGYLGSISDRSKELFFKKQTVGQYLMAQLDYNQHTSLKNQIFYRQDYLDEFNTIWESQAQFHKELTIELKEEIREIIIFYQRRLKSQKGLISYCEFESRPIEVEVDGRKKIKTTGSKVCPKSSPLFQEFKIWQILNNIQVIDKTEAKRFLNQEEKDILFHELNIKDRISKNDALKLLYRNYKDLDLNFRDIEGNRTQSSLYKAYQTIIELSGHGKYDFSKMRTAEITEIIEPVFKSLGYNSAILKFNSNLEGKEIENQPMYQFWHLLYSFEGDSTITGNEKLLSKITELYGFEKEYALIIANVTFQSDYGSLSTKAIRKILPHLKDGFAYAGRKENQEEPSACEYAGYRHAKNSLTKSELENKILKDKLDILPKNSLRNPVVEKILNQMINVVNATIETYGKPDEIRIELARELKKSADEREQLTNAINKTTIDHEIFKEILQKEFGLTYVSRNDIIRYKLYKELEFRGFQTLYSNTYISPNKLFSKEFDIEHIIPQSRLFDDSFSNKTLESRSVNIEKGNETAIDYITTKKGADGIEEYLNRIAELFKAGKISKTKYNKLKMKGADIPSDFINRDLRDTQYIAKKAKNILEELVKDVVSTTGSITDKLRADWQLIDVMQELNWDKYDKQGLTETIENREGHKIKRIIDWTKRNDHRHHAMDALTIAFTKRSHIQYLNNLNSRSNKSGSIYGIEAKELYRDDKGKLKFKPPMPLNDFRAEAKKHLESTLISIKAKNKVCTINLNTTKKKNGVNKKKQLTPRGQLHLETVYGSIKQYKTKSEKIGASFNEEQILKVSKKKYRELLLMRLKEFDNDPKKAFTGKNSLEKNPLFIDDFHTQKVPERVILVEMEPIYTIHKDISPDLKIEKIIDSKVRSILESRLKAFNGDSKKAFSNLEENPIWLNQDSGIAIKRVSITGISNAISLHDKRDKDGKLILDAEGKTLPVDFVNTGNNHHVAIYKDENGNLKENVIPFFVAIERASQGLPIIDKGYKKEEGWEYQFSMKQNEYFVFPNEINGFNPIDIDLFNPDNYCLVGPNLFRVQSISSKYYIFNHQYETKNADGTLFKTKKQLSGITYIFFQNEKWLNGIVKVRINHIGQIVSIGEY